MPSSSTADRTRSTSAATRSTADPARQIEEPIEVRQDWVAGMAVPAQFLWQDRLWLVRDVRGWPVDPGGIEVWRVVAGDGREGRQGVYELVHTSSTGQWRLRTVAD